jgi:hypothetical protein
VTTKKKADDLGQAEAQEKVDTAEDQGFLGQKVDPIADEEYSLQSGPDAPPVNEQGVRAAQIHADPEA